VVASKHDWHPIEGILLADHDVILPNQLFVEVVLDVDTSKSRLQDICAVGKVCHAAFVWHDLLGIEVFHNFGHTHSDVAVSE
jgi:hypothetical protein